VDPLTGKVGDVRNLDCFSLQEWGGGVEGEGSGEVQYSMTLLDNFVVHRSTFRQIPSIYYVYYCNVKSYLFVSSNTLCLLLALPDHL
jgi:hypothetical protein